MRVACSCVRVHTSLAKNTGDMHMGAPHLWQSYRSPSSPPCAQGTQMFLSLADSLVCLFLSHLRALSLAFPRAFSRTHPHTFALFLLLILALAAQLSPRNYYIYHTTLRFVS